MNNPQKMVTDELQEEGVFQRKASIRMYLGKPIVWFSGGLEIQMG